MAGGLLTEVCQSVFCYIACALRTSQITHVSARPERPDKGRVKAQRRGPIASCFMESSFIFCVSPCNCVSADLARGRLEGQGMQPKEEPASALRPCSSHSSTVILSHLAKHSSSADLGRCHSKAQQGPPGSDAAVPCICFSSSSYTCHFLSSSTHLPAFVFLQTLIEAVQKHGEGRWEEMRQHFSSDRTAAQLMQRWALIHKRPAIHPPDSETPKPSDTLGREAGRITRSTDSRLRHGGGWGQPRSTRSSTGGG